MTSGEGGERKARQRISTACLGCRDKKTKCDGNTVQCGACAYRGQECVYLITENKRKPPSKAYVKALEARVASLERQLATAQAVNKAQQQQQQLFQPTSTDHPLGFSHEDEAPSPNPIDEVADTLGRFQIADGGEVRYFGSRSNFHLLQTAMAGRKSSRAIQMEGFEAAKSTMSPINLTDELQNHLLDLYWRWQNPWQYFVSRSLFMSSFSTADGHEFGRFHSPLLVTAMYALASRYSDRVELRADPDDPNTAGDCFLSRVKTMLQYESEAPTTATVQAVLLLSLCEAARDKEALGFVYCGMATRMALNLGLNIDCSACVSQGLLTAEEVEHRQVTWWGVYMLDKLFNIGLGRPSMIRERDITTRLPSLNSADELTPWDSSSSNGDNHDQQQPQPSYHVSLSMQTHNMFAGVAEALDFIYSPHTSSSSGEKENAALKAHVRLVAFHASLPTHLRISTRSRKIITTTTTTTRPALPHVYQLHLQYHVVTILLHRPFLKATTIAQQNNGGHGGGLADDTHAEACRASAESISHILQCHKAAYGLRTMPISTIHGVFTATIIFLADAASPPSPSTSSESSTRKRDRALRHAGICVEALEALKVAWYGWSSRALVVLGTIARAWGIGDVVPGLEGYGDGDGDGGQGYGDTSDDGNGVIMRDDMGVEKGTATGDGIGFEGLLQQQQQQQHDDMSLAGWLNGGGFDGNDDIPASLDYGGSGALDWFSFGSSSNLG